MNLFDACIITTASDRQAAAVRTLLQRRIDHGLYPREIEFHVFADPARTAPGSAGATLLALDALARESNDRSFLDKKKILVINAGGANRGLPCYAPEGKLFVPLPVDSSSVLPPVVLDLQLARYLKYPWRCGEILVAAGDVVFDFDPASVPADRGDLCGFAVSASLDQGSRHGVFRFDASQVSIVDYYQKQPAGFLHECARIEGTAECALDAGLLSVSSLVVKTLLGAGPKGAPIMQRVSAGTAGFDWYLEVITATCAGMTAEEYGRRVRNRSRLDPAMQAVLFSVLQRFTVRAVLAERSAFVHVGRIETFIANCRELHRRGLSPFYGGPNDEVKAYCSDELVNYNSTAVEIPLHGARTVLVEGSSQCTFENLMGGNIVAGVRNLSSQAAVPENICIDERRIGSRIFRCVYSTHDTFGPAVPLEAMVFCGVPLVRWLQERSLTAADLWSEGAHPDLLEAGFFCETHDDDFMAGYWAAGSSPADWTAAFRKAQRLSLGEINRLDDPVARDEERTRNRAAELRSRIGGNAGWRTISTADLKRAFDGAQNRNLIATIAAKTDDRQLAAFRNAQLRSLDIGGGESGSVENPGASMIPGPFFRLARRKPAASAVTATAPLRIDLAGGWSDTPPYGLRHGGAVVNLAIDLNGKPPVSVTVKRVAAPAIVVRFSQEGMIDTITDFDSVRAFASAEAPFGMVRALLFVAGFTAEESGYPTLEKLLRRTGGMEINLAAAVPSASGLGASSILCAAAAAALCRFFGVELDLQATVGAVMQIERLSGTGSGWQDVVGGLVGGVNYAACPPGLVPRPEVFHLDPFLFGRENAGLYTLYDTGIVRPSRTMLADVVAAMYANAPATLFTLRHIRQLADDCRDAIGLRDRTGLGSILTESFNANTRLHAATRNPSIEKLVVKTARRTSGAKLAGAGGGGFAFFASPDRDQAKKLLAVLSLLSKRGGRVVRWSLNPRGLTIRAR